MFVYQCMDLGTGGHHSPLPTSSYVQILMYGRADKAKLIRMTSI